MRCSKCRRDAVVYQRYSGLHLCEQHFNQDVEAKAKRAIREHRWVRSGDTVAVAFSGDGGSSAVLFFLHQLLRERRDVRLMAITVDEGVSGYRNPERARATAEHIGVPWVMASFRDEYGAAFDEKFSCRATLRRTLLSRIARAAGATKLACGYNLDDGARSVLEAVLRGDPGRLTRPMREEENAIPWIKPFMYIPECEVALYASLHVEGYDPAGCPCAADALQNDVRELLDDYTSRHPATKYSLVNLGEALREMVETPADEGSEVEHR
ncbi:MULTISPECIES: ATP-binding protein [unclassified Methanoculleus]|jgi:tRNA(Ile)-lysidine synthase TilS/MesJ|uniref:ATP-binding protein n=2 Tax=unclassified Methanoculleus TaxID=2619537 RepID=UPI00319E7EE9|nr:ATP-binding protein [Methanoculleus sp.]